MTRFLRFAPLAVVLACAATSPPAGSGKAPADSRKMSTVYVYAQAGAILDLCLASPDAASFPEAKSREIGELASRLSALVRSIGVHYHDPELVGVYESTKAHMAADRQLRFHVKNNHQNCGERTLGEMRAYVADNEALIGKFLEKARRPDTRPREGAPK